jgi:hypothetical protein
MKLFQTSQDRDLNLISAYIDNELSPKESAQLERRLKAEPKLRATLADLRVVHTRLADMPKLKVPRSFTLKPAMVGQKPRRQSNLIPIFNYASVLAATLFAVLIGAELSTGIQPMAAQPSAQVFIAEAPVANSEIASESVTQSPDTEALDETQSTESSITALTFTESPNEPLTGSSGGQGGGGGGADGTQPNPPTQPTAEVTITGTVDLFYDTGTPDGSLRVTAETETPMIEEGTPKDVPVPVQDDAVQQAQPDFSPLRLGAILAGAAFVLFLGVSIFLRRR